MSPDAIIDLFNVAVLLPVVVGLAIYVIIQHKALRATELARVEDSKAIVAKLIELSDKWNVTINQLMNVNTAGTEALKELRQSLNELRSAVDRKS